MILNKYESKDIECEKILLEFLFYQIYGHFTG